VIFFDLSATQPLSGTVHGGGEYARSVFHELIERGYGKKLVLLIDGNKELPDDLEKLIRIQNLKSEVFDSDSKLQAILHSGIASRFFSAMPYHYDALDFGNLEIIFTVHGLRPIEMPTDRLEILYANGGSAALKWIAKQIFTEAYRNSHIRKVQRLVSVNAHRTTIVVPSQHTKNSLSRLVPMPDSVSVQVLYSPVTGVARSGEIDSDELSRFGLRKRKFLLIVSGNRWIKNSYRALLAIQNLSQKISQVNDYDIVVTGGLPNRIRNRFAGQIKVLPYVSQRQLRALYSQAFALIYPSLNEGFGYPPLEAMACGTPVISSNACSLPEIAGNAPLYFSPTDPAEIAERIAALLRNPELWQEHRKLGFEHYNEIRQIQERDLGKLTALIMNDQAE